MQISRGKDFLFREKKNLNEYYHCQSKYTWCSWQASLFHAQFCTKSSGTMKSFCFNFTNFRQLTHEATSAFYSTCCLHTTTSSVSLSFGLAQQSNACALVPLNNFVTALTVSVICFVGAVKDGSSGTIRLNTGCMQLDIYLKAFQIGKMTPASKWCLRQLLMLGMPGTGHFYLQLHHISIAVLIKVSSCDSVYFKETFNDFILFSEMSL